MEMRCRHPVQNLHTLLVLDLSLDIVDRVTRLDVECDRLTREGLNEDLHGCRYIK